MLEVESGAWASAATRTAACVARGARKAAREAHLFRDVRWGAWRPKPGPFTFGASNCDFSPLRCACLIGLGHPDDGRPDWPMKSNLSGT